MHDTALVKVKLHAPLAAPFHHCVDIMLELSRVVDVANLRQDRAVVGVELADLRRPILDDVRKVVDEDDEEQGSEDTALRDTRENFAPLRARVTENHSLSAVRKKASS